MNKVLTKALGVVGALAATTVVSTGTAHAAPYCPTFNAYMDDAVPTVVCSASSYLFQAENKAPWTTINKTPAYGFNPAACYQTYHRWLGYADTTGQLEFGFRIVRDDGGACAGPIIGWSFSGGVIRYFTNVYGVLEVQPSGCIGNSGNGVGQLQGSGPRIAPCRPPIVGGDYKGGYHQVCAWMHTVNGTDHEACSTHQLYYP